MNHEITALERNGCEKYLQFELLLAYISSTLKNWCQMI